MKTLLHLVVFWEAEEVAVLHVHQVLSPRTPDVHLGSGIRKYVRKCSSGIQTNAGFYGHSLV